MIEYLPWSDMILNETISSYRNGKFSILDIELGGQCNLSCIYCDSPDRSKLSKVKFSDIETVISENDIKWVFVCGLGEPTFKDNKKYLLKLLKLCFSKSIKCSIFTNLLAFDSDVIEFINNGTLYILFKLDSFNVSVINKIYGTNKGQEILYNIQKIPELVSKVGPHTNIAASIVPTKMNNDEIFDIVTYCFKNDIYPLLGILEEAGSAINKFEDLFLSRKRLTEISEIAAQVSGENYEIPVCPSVIGGIHIDHNSDVIVDKVSGLSCHWFWTKTPEIKIISDFHSETQWYELERQIVSYRNKQLNSLKMILHKNEEMPIGGCGGNVKLLLNKYCNLQSEL